MSPQPEPAMIQSHFIRGWNQLRERATNKMELFSAAGDTTAARNERAKIEAIYAVEEILERAADEATVEATATRFRELLDDYQRRQWERIELARADGDHQTRIGELIKFNYAGGPALGVFVGAYKKVTGVRPWQEYPGQEASTRR